MNTNDRHEDDPPADKPQAPESAQNPADPQPEGGGHSPDQAAGASGDGDDGRG